MLPLRAKRCARCIDQMVFTVSLIWSHRSEWFMTLANDRMIPGIGNKANIINVYNFVVVGIFILSIATLLSFRKITKLFVFESFRIVIVLCGRLQHKHTQKKSVLFDNKLLNIIILKWKQNASNCNLKQQQRRRRWWKKRKREKATHKNYDTYSMSTVRAQMSILQSSTVCVCVYASVRLRFDKSVVIICVKKNGDPKRNANSKRIKQQSFGSCCKNHRNYAHNLNAEVRAHTVRKCIRNPNNNIYISISICIQTGSTFS